MEKKEEEEGEEEAEAEKKKKKGKFRDEAVAVLMALQPASLFSPFAASSSSCFCGSQGEERRGDLERRGKKFETRPITKREEEMLLQFQ